MVIDHQQDFEGNVDHWTSILKRKSKYSIQGITPIYCGCCCCCSLGPGSLVGSKVLGWLHSPGSVLTPPLRYSRYSSLRSLGPNYSVTSLHFFFFLRRGGGGGVDVRGGVASFAFLTRKMAMPFPSSGCSFLLDLLILLNILYMRWSVHNAWQCTV